MALHRAPWIIISRRLFPVAGLAPLAVPRDAVVDYRAHVEQNKASCRERVLRRKSTPLAITFATHRRKWTSSTALVAPCAASSAKAMALSSTARLSVLRKSDYPTDLKLLIHYWITPFCFSLLLTYVVYIILLIYYWINSYVICISWRRWH